MRPWLVRRHRRSLREGAAGSDCRRGCACCLAVSYVPVACVNCFPANAGAASLDVLQCLTKLHQLRGIQLSCKSPNREDLTTAWRRRRHRSEADFVRCPRPVPVPGIVGFQIAGHGCALFQITYSTKGFPTRRVRGYLDGCADADGAAVCFCCNLGHRATHRLS